MLVESSSASCNTLVETVTVPAGAAGAFGAEAEALADEAGSLLAAEIDVFCAFLVLWTADMANSLAGRCHALLWRQVLGTDHGACIENPTIDP